MPGDKGKDSYKRIERQSDNELANHYLCVLISS